MAKEYVIVKGKVVRMNDAAFNIASKHFGASKNRPAEKVVPIELLKMPKLQIQPKKIETEITKIEAVKEPVKQIPVESVAAPVTEENEPKIKEPVRVTRRKR